MVGWVLVFGGWFSGSRFGGLFVLSFRVGSVELFWVAVLIVTLAARCGF